jgi:hypothetical protein
MRLFRVLGVHRKLHEQAFMRTLVLACLVACSQSFEPIATSEDEATARKDCFACFEGCANALATSDDCKEGRDWTLLRNTDASGYPRSDAIVIAPHGGGIELGTYELAYAVSEALRWDRYRFEAHATDACKRHCGASGDFEALHITSTNWTRRACSPSSAPSTRAWSRCTETAPEHRCAWADGTRPTARGSPRTRTRIAIPPGRAPSSRPPRCRAAASAPP